MPELPDIELYLTALRERVIGKTLHRLRIASPFVLRTFEPPVEAVEGHAVTGLRRLGKRIVFELHDDHEEPLFIVVHLMIAGRFRSSDKQGVTARAKIGLAPSEFDRATSLL